MCGEVIPEESQVCIQCKIKSNSLTIGRPYNDQLLVQENNELREENKMLKEEVKKSTTYAELWREYAENMMDKFCNLIARRKET